MGEFVFIIRKCFNLNLIWIVRLVEYVGDNILVCGVYECFVWVLYVIINGCYYKCSFFGISLYVLNLIGEE